MTSDTLIDNSVTQTQITQSAQKTQASRTALAGDFDQFLTLLTTQLQNQDPLNPMDSTQFTQQLVQFNQVEQQINTNQKLDSLVSFQMANVTSAALGFVGMDVTYPAAELNYEDSRPVDVYYSLDSSPASAKINIKDADGNLVYTSTVPKDTGTNKFTWDGSTIAGEQAAPGTYSLSIDALDSANKPVNVQTVVSGRVRGVEAQNGNVELLIGDRAVDSGTIINAVRPKDTTATTDVTG